MVSIASTRLVRAGIVVLIAATVAATISLLPAPARAATVRPSAELVPGSGALIGAYVDPDGLWSGNATQQNEITSFESRIGRKLAIVQHYYSWTNTFPSGLEQWDIAGGRTPLVSWAGVSLDAILSGSYDAMIRARADGMKALGAPVFLRWCWEMNGNWYPCDGTHNNTPGTTDGPAKFVAAWRHIHDLFAAQGATNVVWVWSPNNDNVPSVSWNHFTNYYPGDEYVDWVGIDGYNWGSTRSWSTWRSFSSLFSSVYSAYAARKPIMIAETSSAEQGGNKADWITAARATIQSQFPAIAAVMWFDVLKENDWRVDSSGGSFAAYASMATDPYFRPDAAPPPPPLPAPIAVSSVSASPQVAARSTTVSFTLNQSAAVTIRVSNGAGSTVRNLVSGATFPSGTSSVRWDARDDDHHRLPRGTYTITVTAAVGSNSASATAQVQLT